MSQHTRALWLLAATSSLWGCTVEQAEPAAEVDTPREVEAIEIDGQLFVPLTAEMVFESPLGVYAEESDEFPFVLGVPPPSELTYEELAHALRPVTQRGGVPWVAAEPAWQAAEVAIELAGQSFDGGEPYDPDGVPEIVEGKACCGSDDRTHVKYNDSWPWSTVMTTMRPDVPGSSKWGSNVHRRECTWQMIGPSTALAVAHCFVPAGPEQPIWINEWNVKDPRPLRYGFGPDVTDNVDFPIPSGFSQGQEWLVDWKAWFLGPSSPVSEAGPPEAFEPWVPLASLFGGAIEWDFAVIDFRDAENSEPGYGPGWQGWGVYDAETIYSTYYQHPGVPKRYQTDAWIPWDEWPRIFKNIGSVKLVGPYWIDYDGDCVSGDSGSAIWQYINEGWRVTGVTHGYFTFPSGEEWCVARRLDSVYYAFLQATSEF